MSTGLSEFPQRIIFQPHFNKGKLKAFKTPNRNYSTVTLFARFLG